MENEISKSVIYMMQRRRNTGGPWLPFGLSHYAPYKHDVRHMLFFAEQLNQVSEFEFRVVAEEITTYVVGNAVAQHDNGECCKLLVI